MKYYQLLTYWTGKESLDLFDALRSHPMGADIFWRNPGFLASFLTSHKVWPFSMHL